METNEITLLAGDGRTELPATWHLPTRRATNGAIIVLHPANSNRHAFPVPEICQGAADLGLTALRFDFRSVHSQEPASKIHAAGLDDLLGAYNFLYSFGKEIKPKRIYLAGYSRGASIALLTAGQPAFLPGPLTGLMALMPPLHDPSGHNPVDYPGLSNLTMPKLLLTGENDPICSGPALSRFAATLPTPTHLEILPGTGHYFEPRPIPPALTAAQISSFADNNTRQAVTTVLSWLEEQDTIREDLRK